MLGFRFIIVTEKYGEDNPQIFATFGTLAEAAFALGSMATELASYGGDVSESGDGWEFRCGDLLYYIDEIIS